MPRVEQGSVPRTVKFLRQGVSVSILSVHVLSFTSAKHDGFLYEQQHQQGFHFVLCLV